MKIRNIVTFVASSLLIASVAFAGDSTEVKKSDSTEMKMMNDSTAHKAKPDSLEKKAKMNKEPEMKETKSGVKYFDLVVGEGVECKIGTNLSCHYTLWFSDKSGKKGERVQSSKDSGNPYSCTLGKNLIKGWSDGMVGMNEGGTRQLLIPPELAYGTNGRQGIPPNQWLVFEIDYVKHLKN